ncbi:Fur family transcriptional regulator [Allorhizocola rhizosphaerae]|uniref:Fur family transcriptional regulator n=1 Tax=Allorhizocola rhizosphaerae TaxID=1872709 RepID=UPI000E3DCA61|nr:transcriptional repressor [Allorhizocola rhizosphaerae]
MAESIPGTARSTRQRGEILTILRETEDFKTAQQLFADLRQQGSKIGLTTVYRNLQALADAGEADTMRLPNGEQLYRLCGQGRHHHHLVCRNCGRTIDIEGPAVEKWTERVADEHGFTDVSHTLEIFGTCATCAAESR